MHIAVLGRDIAPRLDDAETLRAGLRVENAHAPFDGVNALWTPGDDGDRYAASLGEGLQVLEAARMIEEGKSLDEIKAYLLSRRPHMCQFFTVDDLAYLKRGGRISSATALIGTVLSIKPILRGDETGHIVSCGKVRGMKRAYQELANYYDGRALDKSEMLGIAHADNEEGAQALIALLRDKGFTGECLNVVYEPVTGAHVGPGTVALFFYGKEK